MNDLVQQARNTQSLTTEQEMQLCRQLADALEAAEAKIETAQQLLYAAKAREEAMDIRIATLERQLSEAQAEIQDARSLAFNLLPNRTEDDAKSDLCEQIQLLGEAAAMAQAEMRERCANAVTGYIICINGTEYYADERIRALPINESVAPAIYAPEQGEHVPSAHDTSTQAAADPLRAPCPNCGLEGRGLSACINCGEFIPMTLSLDTDQAAADHRDAQRYRWLRVASAQNGAIPTWDWWDELGDVLAFEFDNAIDAAMRAEKPAV